MPFTVVFDGDIRGLPLNLLKYITSFGTPLAIAEGDKLKELDELAEKAWSYDELCK